MVNLPRNDLFHQKRERVHCIGFWRSASDTRNPIEDWIRKRIVWLKNENVNFCPQVSVQFKPFVTPYLFIISDNYCLNSNEEQNKQKE